MSYCSTFSNPTINGGDSIICHPSTSLIFGNGASLNWDKGKLEFKGDMNESAIAFLEYLKPYVDAYIKENAPFGNLEYLEWLYNKKFGKTVDDK